MGQLEYASQRLLDTYEIVLEAVKNDGLALYYVSDRLKNEYEIVLKAVSNNGFSLQFVTDELNNNYCIVETAVRKSYKSFIYSRLQSNFDLFYLAISKYKDLEFFRENLQIQPAYFKYMEFDSFHYLKNYLICYVNGEISSLPFLKFHLNFDIIFNFKKSN
jgi:hypothetical protein